MYHWNEPYFTPSLCPRNLNEEFRANFALLNNNSCLSDASQFSEKIYFNLLRPKLKSTYQNKHKLGTSCCSSRCCMLHVAEMNFDVPEKCTSDDILDRLSAPLFSGMGSFKFSIFDVQSWSIAKQVISL